MTVVVINKKHVFPWGTYYGSTLDFWLPILRKSQQDQMSLSEFIGDISEKSVMLVTTCEVVGHNTTLMIFIVIWDILVATSSKFSDFI